MTPSRIEVILDEMRRGGTVVQGSSRCHVEYGWDADGFFAESFDEGAGERHRCSEDTIRGLYRRDPDLFAGLLRRHGWRRFRQAFERDEEEVRAALAWIALHGDKGRHAAIWATVIDDLPPSLELAARVRDQARGSTLWHTIMTGLGWEQDAVAGRRGLWFLDRLSRQVPGLEQLSLLRADFLGMTGDRQAAIAVLRADLTAAPKSPWSEKVRWRLAQLEGTG